MHHYNHPGGMRHDMIGYGMMNYTWVWLIGFVVLAIIILVGIYLIIRQLKQMKNQQAEIEQLKKNQNGDENSVLHILQTRFAQGEIMEEQYKQKRHVLEEE